MFSHMINLGRFWMFSLYYVVSELWGSVRKRDKQTDTDTDIPLRCETLTGARMQHRR